MLIRSQGFREAELAVFRERQRQSFAILEETAAGLRPGDTEREVAKDLVRRFRAAGAQAFFHLPVVLFGERTALPGDWPVGKFFPRRRALAPGDSVILDAAPIFDGYLVDTSYSFCCGDNPEHARMMLHLAEYRRSLPEAIERGDSFREMARAVNARMATAGYEAVHRKHPGQVLGHRAIRTPHWRRRPRLRGFDALSLGWFQLKDGLASRGLGRRSPLWNELKASDHPAHDGLWLVEPHAGCGPLGAKWEEILVIEDGRARWLDEQPPHVRQWQQIAQGADYGPLVRGPEPATEWSVGSPSVSPKD